MYTMFRIFLKSFLSSFLPCFLQQRQMVEIILTFDYLILAIVISR